MKKENFRLQDQAAVQKVHDYIEELQLDIKIHISQGNYALAEMCTEKITKCLNEIGKMRKAKRTHDTMVGVAQMFTERGIKADLITAAR